MSYLGGIDYGSDQVSSRRYLDNVLLYNSEDGVPNKSHGRHYSGYDYHPYGANYNPPISARNFVPRLPQNIPNIPRPMNELNKSLNTISSHKTNNRKEGLVDSLYTISLEHLLIYVIILITIIYCMSLYKLTCRINEMQKYNEMAISLESLRTLLLSTRLKT